MRTTDVNCNVDSWVNEQSPGKHHGHGSRIWVCGDNAANKRRRIFLFAGRPFRIGDSVTQVILHLYAKGGQGGSHDLKVQRVSDKWGEKHINWNNQPPVAGSIITKTVGPLADKDEIQIDVTTIYQDVTTGSPGHGLRIALPDGDTAKFAFYATEHPSHTLRPWIEFRWAEKPMAPLDGAPSGGNGVSPAKPIFDWRFGVKGRDADQKQSAFQLQVSPNADMSAPIIDTGKVIDDRTMYDSSAQATSLVDGTTYYWRVKGWDDDDQASDWSDTWRFKRLSAGTLTLNSPPVGPPSVVNDLTPPITWAFTGRTQAQFEVALFRKRTNGTWKRIWLLHRHKSTDTSVNVPAGKIDRAHTYLVKVRVWDDQDRQSIPGAMNYVEVSRQFTYVKDGTPAMVTNLAATPYADGSPGITISWDDATEPDYYCITVNGVEVIPRLEPADVLVTAGAPSHYAYVFWRAEHGVNQTIEVERVVNSAGTLKHSNSPSISPVKTNVEGKWLVDDDPAEPLAVWIWGQEQSSFGIGESGETFNPLNSQRPIRIIDAMRGAEGGISGALQSTAAARNFQTLKGRVGKTLRYVAQHMNVPVMIGETDQLAPKADAENIDAWVLGTDLFQVGEFFDVVGLDAAADDDE